MREKEEEGARRRRCQAEERLKLKESEGVERRERGEEGVELFLGKLALEECENGESGVEAWRGRAGEEVGTVRVRSRMARDDSTQLQRREL